MKKYLFILLLASVLLITGCPDPTETPVNDEDDTELIFLEVTSAGMEFLDVRYEFIGTQKVETWEFWLYENENDTENKDWKWKPGENPVRFKNLTPDHEYTLKVEATDDYYNKYQATKKVSTNPKTAPEIKGEFITESNGNSFVKISWKEVGSFTKKVELHRADTENGEYALIKTDDYPSNDDNLQDTTIEDKKTYWYKIITYEKTASEEYTKIGESKPIEVATGASVPKPIPSENIICKKGITTLSFTWPEVTGAEKYITWLRDGNFSFSNTIDSKDVEENSVVYHNLESDKSYCFYIKVQTDGGESTESYSSFKTSMAGFPSKYSDSSAYYKCEPKVIADQTKATYSFGVPFEDFTDCKITFSLRKDTEADSELIQDIGELENYFFIRENLSPATSYSSSSYSNNTSGYIHMTVTYKDAAGNDIKNDSYIQVNSFYTKNLNPPSNLQITSISKTEATISFDVLTEEEKLGKKPKYSIYAYDKNDNLARDAKGDFISVYGESSPLTIKNLTKGTEYIFKAKTSFDKADGSAPNEHTQVTGHTASGIEQKPVVTLTEVQPGDDESFYRGVYTYIKADWDALDKAEGVKPENIIYGIEYRIFEHNKYSRPYNLVPSTEDPSKKVHQDRTYSGTESFSDKFLVNGGNTYTVRVYAYDSEEPGDIVYSDPVKVQLEKIDDSQMYGALKYSEWFAEYANEEDIKEGGIVDFANEKVWVNEKTFEQAKIRSTSKAYNAGYLQLFGKVEQTKFLFPSYDGYKFVSFKFNFEKAIENPTEEKVTCVPKILLFDRDCFNFQLSDYGYIDAVYYVIPNEQGTIIQEHNNDEEPYLFERYRMPYFQNNSTTTNPSEAGLEVDEKFVFNNSVYMGVSQKTAGNIGFSYYY